MLFNWFSAPNCLGRLILACLLYFCLLLPARAEGRLSLVTGNDYQPFTDQAMPGGGLFTSLVREIYARMDVELEIRFRPWKRGYVETLSGGFDATFPYIRASSRERDYYYSDPVLFVFTQVYVANLEGPMIADWPDLEGRVTCLPVGYANTPKIEMMVSDGRVNRVTSRTLGGCFRRLAGGRIDFVEVNNFTAGLAITQSGLGEGRFRPTLLRTENVGHHLIFPRKAGGASGLLERFNRELAAMRNEGEIERIIADYLEDLEWQP